MAHARPDATDNAAGHNIDLIIKQCAAFDVFQRRLQELFWVECGHATADD
jgi:hypothetical protein